MKVKNTIRILIQLEVNSNPFNKHKSIEVSNGRQTTG